MTQNPFINLRLRAAALADASYEIRHWVGELVDILELGVATHDEAYDLLAIWGKLRRVRPELIRAANGDEVASEAGKLISQHGLELVDRALCIPNPVAWLREAEKLEELYGDLTDASERAHLAEELLNDLDDAEVVLAAARKIGRDDPELGNELAKCTGWVAEHADSFLSVSVYVQSVGLGFRHDLHEVDYDLAATTLKFVDLLRAAENAERQLALADVTPLTREVVVELHNRQAQASLPSARDKTSGQRDPHLAMAAQSALPTAFSPNRGRQSATVSVYKLRDQEGRDVELRTDPNGRVFVVLPEDIFLAVPKRVLINHQSYLLTPSQPPLIEIVDLRKGDLRELASGDFIVKGTWQ